MRLVYKKDLVNFEDKYEKAGAIERLTLIVGNPRIALLLNPLAFLSVVFGVAFATLVFLIFGYYMAISIAFLSTMLFGFSSLLNQSRLIQFANKYIAKEES